MTTPPPPDSSTWPPPTFEGAAGKAWRFCDSHPAGVTWLLELPGIYSSIIPIRFFWLSVAHLRPIEGVEAAKVRRPGATHEVVIVGLNPNHPNRYPVPGTPIAEIAISWLLPFEVCHQVCGLADEGAAQLGESIARAATEGRYIPDSDRRLDQVSQIEELAAHYRGEHAKGDA